ncbi:MAG TPA: class I SAM-dependent methyltransferase [Trebonia sp.]|nr:class I SAM-dependent methyltransferase [Trebonia sp.]HVV31570.1 class I SAM-dependent methyltransferase [Mycobacteriales bacterium]
MLVAATSKSLARKGLTAAGRSRPGQRLLRFYAFYGLLPSVAPPVGQVDASSAATLIATAPTEMSPDERSFLYALVRGTRPQRILEIGTAEGGSALLMAAALEDSGGDGRIVTIDPAPRLTFDTRLLHGRVDFVTGVSPDAVPEAIDRAGARFDLVLIDGIHIYDQARRDLAAALENIADQAYLLFHDSFHVGVAAAIAEAVEADPRLHDCGYVCNRPRPVGDLATHAGFRLVRVGPPVVDAGTWVRPMWAGLGKPAPQDASLRNHDFWYCSAISACAYCREHGSDQSVASIVPS